MDAQDRRPGERSGVGQWCGFWTMGEESRGQDRREENIHIMLKKCPLYTATRNAHLPNVVSLDKGVLAVAFDELGESGEQALVVMVVKA